MGKTKSIFKLLCWSWPTRWFFDGWFRRVFDNSDPEIDWDRLPKWLTIRETSRLLKVHPNTLRSWDEQGKLRAMRLGSRRDRRYQVELVREQWLRDNPRLEKQVNKPRRLGFSQLKPWRLWLRPVGLTTTVTVVLLLLANLQFAQADQLKKTSVVLSPQGCSGWSRTDRAIDMEVSDGAPGSLFTANNSAVYLSTQDRLSDQGKSGIITGSLDSPSSSFTCTGFRVDDLPSKTTLSNTRLVLSFHAQAIGNVSGGFVLATSPDGQKWTDRAVLTIPTNKPGRQYIELPNQLNPDNLSNLQVKLTPDVDIDSPDVTAWLDAVVVTTDVMPTGTLPSDKENREAKKEMDRLTAFSKATYDTKESPILTIPKKRVKKFLFFRTEVENWDLNKVDLVDQQGRHYKVAYNIVDVNRGDAIDSNIKIDTRGLHAGKYNLRLTMERDGQTVTIDKEFVWGVLAVNFTRPSPRPGDQETVGLAVLDDAGVTICDAALEVKVTSPRGKNTTYRTQNKTIVTNSKCVDKGVTNEPDYHFNLIVDESGTYHFKVKAKTRLGERTVEENLVVDAAVMFDVVRADYPTRIYPPADYPVTISVTPKRDYYGAVAEQVPGDFVISDTLPNANVRNDELGNQKIEWVVNWKAGQTYQLHYTFDAPDISPALFLTGPLTIGGSFIETPIFQEPRSWQIASDATSITVSGTLYSDEGSTVINCSSANKTVKIEVNASAQYSGTCTASDGTYSIGSVSVEASDVLTIYIDGASENASRTTRVAGTPANITGAHLYQNRVIVSHEDAGPITNTNLDNWDSGNDDDVQYTVTTGALTVVAGSKLIVWTGKTYTPGGTVTTTAASNQSNPDGDVAIQSSATMSMGTNALSVGGDYANSGTFSKSTGQTTTFTGTTTGFTIAPGSSSNFDALTFNGASGGWTINAAQTVDTTLTLTDGAVTVDGDMTITTSLSVATNKTLTINFAKTVTLGATSGTSLTLNGTITGAGTLTYKTTTAFPTSGTISSILRMDCTSATPLYLSARTYGGVVEAYSNTSTNSYVYMGTSASPQQTLTFSSHVYVHAAGSANYTLLHADNFDPIVNITGNIDFTGSGAATEYLSIGSGAWTVSGNIDFTSGTVAANSSNTLTMNGSNTTLTGANQNLGSLTFAPPDGGTINVATSQTNVGGVLTVAENKTVAIASGAVLSPYTTTSTISLAGTISGDGSLTIRSTNVGLTTAGTISVKYVYYRCDLGNCSVPARTYSKAGGEFWFFHVGAVDYTATLGSGTFNILGNMFFKAQSTGKITIDGTANDPIVNVAGWLNTHTATALQVLTLDGGTWTISDWCYLQNLTLNFSGSHTFKMDAALDGVALLQTGTNTLNNLEISSSGTVTVAAASHAVAGNLILGGSGTPTVTSSTIVMSGTAKTITGGGKTLNNLTVSGTATLQTSDLTVSGTLNVADTKSLTMDTGRTLALSANTGTNLNLNTTGTLNGPGRLTYRNSATTFPTAGTLAATLITRFDTVNGNMVIPARTDYGAIEAYGGSANARTVTLGTSGSQTITTSGYFYVMADAASTNHVTLQGATYDPTLNVGGDFDFTGTGAASEIVTAPNAAATWTVNGNVNLTDGTWTASAETLQLGGTTSATLDTACTDVSSCTTTKLNNLTINKTAAGAGDDNVTLTTNGVRLAGTLTITDGELVQGALNVRAEGGTAVSIGASGQWTNTSTGDLVLGGTFTNAGTAVFNSNAGTQCTNGNDDIAITSTSGGTQRAWSNTGAGTTTIYNVSATDMTDSSITAYTSTLSNTTWTVGACGISVSGTVYQSGNEGTAFNCDSGSGGVNLALRVSVNGAAATSGTCSVVGGTFTVSNVTAPSGADIPVAIYTDNTANPSQKTTTVTLSSGTGNITGLTLIIDRVVVSQESGTAMSNTYLDTANNNGDAGIRYGVASGTLTVDSGMELHVLATKNFTPAGVVTTTAAGTAGVAGNVHIPVGATLNMAGNALNVGGNLTNAGTLTVTGSQTTTMTATSTGFTLTSGGATLRNLTFNGTSGGWTNSGTLAIGVAMTLTDGAVTINDNTTVATTLTVASGKTLTINSGKTVTLNKVTAGTTLSLSGTIDGVGTLIYQNAWTKIPSTGTLSSKVNFLAGDDGIVLTTRTYGGDVTCEGNGSVSMASCVLEAGNPIFNGDLTVTDYSGSEVALDAAANPTVTLAGNFNATPGSGGATVAMGSGVWTVSGNFTISPGVIFQQNTGTLKMNGVDKTLTTDADYLYDFELTGGSVTIVGELWVNDLTISTGELKGPSSGTFTVSGHFTNNATYTHNSGVVSMRQTHNITGSSSTAFYWLTIYGTISVPTAGQDITVANKLDLTTGNSLLIETGRKVTLLPAATLTLAGTISGAGTLVYQSTTIFPTGGVISAPLRMDTTNNDQSMSARTYGGQVEIYNNSSSATRTVTLASASAYTFSSNVYLNAANTKDISLDVSTNSPVVNITGDLDFTGSGTGMENISAGNGTWTVSGNVNLTGGYFAPFYIDISPTWNKMAKKISTWTGSGFDCSDSVSYDCATTGLTIGFDDQSEGGLSCPAVDTDFHSADKYSLAGLDNGSIITGVDLLVDVATVGVPIANVARYATDAPESDACTSASSGLFSRAAGVGGTSLGIADWGSSAKKRMILSTTEAMQVKARLTGSDAIAFGYSYPSDGAVSPTTTNSAQLRVGYTLASTPTLVMNGTGTLTPGGNGFNNLTLSGSVTLASEAFNVAGDLDMRDGAVTPASSSITMTGTTSTIYGGGNTLHLLYLDLAGSGTTTLAATGSDLTVSGLVSIASGDVLSLGSGRTLYYTSIGSNMVINGTVAGSGILEFPYDSQGPGLLGTITAPVRFNATDGVPKSDSFRARAYGGTVTYYNNHASASRTLTFGAGTFTFASDVTLSAPGGGTLIVELNTNDPSSTISGNVTIGANTTFSANSANALNINGNFTNSGTFTHNSGTVTLAGSAQQDLTGTLNGATGKFQNLVITNAFGDGSTTWSATFGSGVETAATFTAATANTKLRFAAGATNTMNNINLSGTNGNLVIVRSSSPGTTSLFAVASGSPTVTYASIKDNDACSSNGGSGIDASGPGTNVDLGNTPCWLINALTASLSANAVNLGSIDANNISQAGIDSTVTTNAVSGYISLVKYDQTLTSGSNTIGDASGTTIVKGENEYGASSSRSGNTIAQWSPAACSTTATTSNATALSNTFQSFASKASAASSEQTTLCLLASTTAAQAPGTYQSTLTIVTTARY